MARPQPPNPPTHLRAETKDWWSEVVSAYELEPHHHRLLRLACEAWDRCQQARAAIAKHGMVYEDRFGSPRLRPEVGVERDSRAAFARLLRELGLDVMDPDDNRPPTIGGNAQHRK